MVIARFQIWFVLATLARNAVVSEFPKPGDTTSATPQDMFMVDNQRDMAQLKPDIVGGQPAGLTQFPFYAQWWGNPQGSTSTASCGASLIHSDILLTAAHCNIIANNVNVIVGEYYNPQVLFQQGTLRTVTSRAVHPSYSGAPNYAFDFLVLKLNTAVPSPAVPLNSNPNSPVTNELLTAIGVGLTKYRGKPSPVLMKVNVNYVDPVTCSNNYVGTGTSVNSAVQLCSGVPGGGKGTCQGDSGGPVLNAQGVQVGVVSSAVGCAQANFPSINSRVSGALSWIQQQICALSSYPPQYCFRTAVATTPVRFDVFYDSNPTITTATLYNSSKVVYAAGPGTTSWVSTIHLPLPQGYYYWQLFNPLGNGFCCSNGFGYIAAFATVNGYFQQIIPPSYATFSGTSVNVSMPVPPRQIAPADSGIGIRVDILYDAYPTETSFSIYKSGGVQPIYSSGLGQPTYAGKLVSINYNMLPAGNYYIQLGDTYGDGFCCTYGIGYFALSLMKNGYYSQLIPPRYGFLNNVGGAHSFTIPSTFRRRRIRYTDKAQSSLGLFPSSTPSIFDKVCQDSPMTFNYTTTVNGVTSTGTQTCQWLANNITPDLEKLLCQPGQQAYKSCPKTCRKCINECEGQDSATATFTVGNAVRNCSWLSTHSSLWPTECFPDKPAYSACKDVCHSCSVALD